VFGIYDYVGSLFRFWRGSVIVLYDLFSYESLSTPVVARLQSYNQPNVTSTLRRVFEPNLGDGAVIVNPKTTPTLTVTVPFLTEAAVNPTTQLFQNECDYFVSLASPAIVNITSSNYTQYIAAGVDFELFVRLPVPPVNTWQW